MRDCVSISAVFYFTGDRDWKVVHSPARLLFWSKSRASAPSSSSSTEQSSRALTAQSMFLFALMHSKVSFLTEIIPLGAPCDLWLLQPGEIIDFKEGKFMKLLRSFVLQWDLAGERLIQRNRLKKRKGKSRESGGHTRLVFISSSSICSIPSLPCLACIYFYG